MLKHLKEELENPQDLVPGISDGAVAIVTKMMAKKPADRYDTCEQIIQDIGQVLEQKAPAHAGAATAESSIQPPRRKRPRAARSRAKGGGCLVLLALGIALFPTLWMLVRLALA
jgi:hypothetical protein